MNHDYVSIYCNVLLFRHQHCPFQHTDPYLFLLDWHLIIFYFLVVLVIYYCIFNCNDHALIAVMQKNWLFILNPATWLNLLISSSRFFLGYLRFFYIGNPGTCIKGQIYFSPYNLYAFYFLFLPYSRISSTITSKTGDSKLLCFVLDMRQRASWLTVLRTLSHSEVPLHINLDSYYQRKGKGVWAGCEGIGTFVHCWWEI